MPRIAATIALIAYLIGGWILPAAHQHRSHPHVCAEHQSPAIDGRTHDAAEVSRPFDRHEHDASSCDPDVDEHAAETKGRSLVSVSAHVHSCDGLCALCSARSLSKTQSRGVSMSLGLVIAVQAVVIAGSDRPVTDSHGVHFSRGPPSAA